MFRSLPAFPFHHLTGPSKWFWPESSLTSGGTVPFPASPRLKRCRLVDWPHLEGVTSGGSSQQLMPQTDAEDGFRMFRIGLLRHQITQICHSVSAFLRIAWRREGEEGEGGQTRASRGKEPTLDNRIAMEHTRIQKPWVHFGTKLWVVWFHRGDS